MWIAVLFVLSMAVLVVDGQSTTDGHNEEIDRLIAAVATLQSELAQLRAKVGKCACKSRRTIVYRLVTSPATAESKSKSESIAFKSESKSESIWMERVQVRVQVQLLFHKSETESQVQLVE